VGRHTRRRPTRKDFTLWGTFIVVVFALVVVAAVLIFSRMVR
jgi:hypothetical protein